jgi:O-methyltransferase
MRSAMRTLLVRVCKEIVYRTPLRRYFFPYFRYNMTAAQLCLLCHWLEKTKNVPGSVVEIGCSTGMTTVFLNKYMDAQGIVKDYIAVDTFSGFVGEDIRHEVRNRGKRASFYTGFRTNKQQWFDGTMRLNGIQRVRSLAADVNQFELSRLGPIAFCLLDVDLYRPTRNALPLLFGQLSGGGILAVDDCDATNIRYDGADQAYKEFCAQMSYPQRIVSGVGVIEKHAP